MLHNNTTNVVQLKTNNTELMILEAREIKHQIDVLQAQYDKLKQALIEGYFATSEEFVGSEGLVMATYKAIDRATFMAAEFKKDHPNLHKEYTVKQVVRTFSVKK